MNILIETERYKFLLIIIIIIITIITKIIIIMLTVKILFRINLLEKKEKNYSFKTLFTILVDLKST